MDRYGSEGLIRVSTVTIKIILSEYLSRFEKAE